MDVFDERYYIINKYLLSCVGLWPYQISRTRQFTFFLGISGLISFCVPQILLLTKYFNDPESVVGTLPSSVGSSLLIIKIIAIIYNFNKLKILLDQIREDWQYFTSDKCVNILKVYAENGRNFTFTYIVISFMPMIVYLVMPIGPSFLDFIAPLNESRSRILIYPAEYFVDEEKYYLPIILHEYFAYIVGLMIVIGCDTIYVVITEHACGMFAILSDRLENLTLENVCTPNERNFYSIIERKSCHYIIECVKLYARTTKFMDLISSTFSICLLADISFGIFMHSAPCVMIVIHMDTTAAVLKYINITLLQTLRLFFSSRSGQKLMDHSSSVCLAAYNSAWYETTIKAKKILLLLILKTQRPCALRIAKLYMINMDSFGSLVKTSLSYCTVVASLQNLANGSNLS